MKINATNFSIHAFQFNKRLKNNYFNLDLFVLQSMTIRAVFFSFLRSKWCIEIAINKRVKDCISVNQELNIDVCIKYLKVRQLTNKFLFFRAMNSLSYIYSKLPLSVHFCYVLCLENNSVLL